jgi:hypothetical protein
MAIPPKGYDRDEVARLRQARYEKTGNWRFATDAQLSNQNFITDQYGNRLYEENGRAARGIGVYDTATGRYSSQSARTDFDPKRQASFIYGAGSQTFVPGIGAAETERIEDEGIEQRPVRLTQIPTSSTNASRPRTVAAGYALEQGARALPQEQRTGKLTVMFRDGTLWNYYGVSYNEWLTFSNALSKGPMLNRASSKQASDGILLSHPHGPADVSDIPEEIQEQLWKVAREAQLRYKTTNRGRGGYTAPDRRISKSKAELTEEQILRRRSRPREYVPKSASKKAGYNPNATRGKAPQPRNSANRRTR